MIKYIQLYILFDFNNTEDTQFKTDFKKLPRKEFKRPFAKHVLTPTSRDQKLCLGHEQCSRSWSHKYCLHGTKKKCTGEEVAVKVFTQPSDSRTLMIQQREFAVLKMLCHNNVVQLFAMEPEISGNMHVLVMQYCSEGTLYRMLSKPEHTFGLEEDEFLIFLRDITEGMKHLCEHQIVHRDIKPGNILCYKADTGRFIYKLTDFGAARALDDSQEFVSLYGTEEYLHPDMYDVAVMKKAVGHKFDAAVDLWSLAVTIYQVATGQLPFQPFGGRKNRTTMHKILAEKKSGVVSGIQKSYGGDIEWSYDFPETCMLSQGLKNLLLPFLAGLLERDSKKTWNFDQYFSQVQEIVSKKVIHLFSPEHFTNYRIYIKKEQNFTNLQELIATQTDVNAANQLLLFEGRLLYDVVNTQQTIDTYPPNITQKHPIFLIISPTNKTLAFEETIPQFPLLDPNAHAIDRTVLRNNVSVIFYIKKLVMQIMLKQDLLRESLRNFMIFQNQTFVTHRDLPTGAVEIMALISTFLENTNHSMKESAEKMTLERLLVELEKQQRNYLKNFSDDYRLNSGCSSETDHCVPTIVSLASRAQELTNRLVDQLNKVNTDQFHELDRFVFFYSFFFFFFSFTTSLLYFFFSFFTFCLFFFYLFSFLTSLFYFFFSFFTFFFSFFFFLFLTFSFFFFFFSFFSLFLLFFFLFFTFFSFLFFFLFFFFSFFFFFTFFFFFFLLFFPFFFFFFFFFTFFLIFLLFFSFFFFFFFFYFSFLFLPFFFFTFFFFLYFFFFLFFFFLFLLFFFLDFLFYFFFFFFFFFLFSSFNFFFFFFYVFFFFFIFFFSFFFFFFFFFYFFLFFFSFFFFLFFFFFFSFFFLFFLFSFLPFLFFFLFFFFFFTFFFFFF
ncbi:TBK1 [Acanthosepion pharaonis]|uniref:IkappaB kinase n=1 Tax=Acanthosepion pharaonis TaxID=158019 RepID=A0A812EB42_ACAPH|nr:TBK1 [Sepia pharaonis]